MQEKANMKFNSKNNLHIQGLMDVAAKRWLSIDYLFDQADTDRSGEVDEEELKNLLQQLRLDETVDLESLWAHLDADGNGLVSRDEWIDAFQGVEANVTTTFCNLTEWRVKPTYNKDVNDGLIALVAHNQMKAQMAAFVDKNIEFFRHTRIITTGSTGKTLEQKLGLNVYHKVASGPLGGDQEIGALVTQGKVSGVFFFKDPLSAHQHAADIEALTRICDVHNVPYATNAASGQALLVAMCSMGLYYANGKEESDTVKSYKSQQAAVINQVSAS